jgi:5-methylcytosine-specific restriction endonuclease McrA
MSRALEGKRHSYRSASTNPKVARKIAAWWTLERRDQKRQEVLRRNPNARYHGLSAKAAKRLTLAAGRCSRCGSTGRLDIHHRDRNKKNQAPENLEVLCHRCHMREHSDNDARRVRVR